jgi:nitrite reductase/ring-hydroxylating ferredoxin subunit/uncharacterized membrane protein
VEAIEKQQWMEPVEETLHKAVSRAYTSSGSVGRRIKNFLHGTWLGHPLHPVLTDVPIGSWTAAIVMDILDMAGQGKEYGRAADAAIGIGLAGAVAAAVAGLTDWQDTDGSARRVGLTHGLLNIAGAGLYATSWAMRKGGNRAAGRAVSMAAYAVAAFSARLGGDLVYGKQIGVNHAASEPLPADFVPVIAEAELREGVPVQVLANGVKVLVVRRGAAVYAIGEVCSHMGGPLAEGDLEGNAIRCPWHHSRFSVETGEVIDGPATHQQPCFETRVRDGRVEVRGREK